MRIGMHKDVVILNRDLKKKLDASEAKLAKLKTRDVDILQVVSMQELDLLREDKATKEESINALQDALEALVLTHNRKMVQIQDIHKKELQIGLDRYKNAEEALEEERNKCMKLKEEN